MSLTRGRVLSNRFTPSVTNINIGSITDVYDSIGQLPLSNVVETRLAYVKDVDRIYIWLNNGLVDGWYNITTINTAPIFDSEYPGDLYNLDSSDPLTVELRVSDPEGVRLIYDYSASDSAQYFVSITQGSGDSDKYFTLTPLERSVIEQYDSTGGSFSIIFTASDGVLTSEATSTFNLSLS